MYLHVPTAEKFGSLDIKESSGPVQGLLFLYSAQHSIQKLRGFQILTAVLMKIAVLWHMTSCDSLLKMTSEQKSYIATNEKWGGVYEHLAQERYHTKIFWMLDK
jgi:hypothetical protein